MKKIPLIMLTLAMLGGCANPATALCTGAAGVPMGCDIGTNPAATDVLLGGNLTSQNPEAGKAVQFTVQQVLATIGRLPIAGLNTAQTQSNLGLVIGTNVEAWNATLDALAALSASANQFPYFTGAQAMGLGSFGSGLNFSAGTLSVNTGTLGATIPLNNAGFTQSGQANFTGGISGLGPLSTLLAPGSAGPGTITVSSGSGVVTGSGTMFTAYFKLGDPIVANSETHTVESIASDTTMGTDNWTNNASGVAYTYGVGTQWTIEPDGRLMKGPTVANGTNNADILDNTIITAPQPNTNYFGATLNPHFAVTAAPTAQLLAGVQTGGIVASTNTQNWTGTPGLVGLEVNPTAVAGATGTITDAMGLLVGSMINGGSGTFLNEVGVGINTLSAGTNSNTELLVGGAGSLPPNAGNWGIVDVTGYPEQFSPHIHTHGSAPTGASCGTGASFGAGSTDGSGRVTCGTTPGATMGFTFNTAWTTNPPVCFGQDETKGLPMVATTVSTTAVTFTTNGAVSINASDKISYKCIGFE